MPALLDEAAHAAGALRLEVAATSPTGPGRRRPARASPVADARRRSARGAGPRAAGSPGSRAISRKARTEPSSGACRRQPGRQPQEREVERRVDVEPRPGASAEVARRRSRPPRGAGRRVVGRAGLERGEGASMPFARSPATTKASALKRLLATDLAGDRGERGRRAARRRRGRQGAGAGVADRVDACRASARRASAPGRRGVPAAPVERLRRSGGAANVERGHRRAERPEPLGELGREPAPPRRRHGGVRAGWLVGSPASRRGRPTGRAAPAAQPCVGGAGPSRPWSCSRCIRSWTPAKRSHSPQRRWPISGWSIGQGSASCPAIAAAESRERAAALGEEGEQRVAASRRRAGDAGAPPAARSAGHSPPAASAAASRASAARRSCARRPGPRSSPPRRRGRAAARSGICAQDALERVADRLLLGQDPRRVPLREPGRRSSRRRAFSPLTECRRGPCQQATTSGACRLEGREPGRRRRRSSAGQRRSKRSTGSTKTVAPPTSTSTG